MSLAPAAPRLGRWLGTERALLVTMVAICAGTALRLIPSTTGLLGGTIVIGAGIAVANVLLPGVIKRDFGSRIGLMTGLYSMSLSIGAALAAGLTVPFERAAHTDWRTTLAVWGLLTVLAVAVWTPQVRRRAHQAAAGTEAQPVHGLWRDPVAWTVTVFMGLQSLGYYATGAFLPTILTNAGMSQSLAGLMLSIANLLGIVGAFSTPVLATRGIRPAFLAVAAAVLTAGGLAGLAVAPVSGAYLWIVLLGLGQSAAFSLAMLFIVLRAPDGGSAAQLSSMAQSCGYLLAAAGPLALGAVHQVEGGWAVPLVLLLALLILQTVTGLGAARERYVAAGQRTPDAR
ncbi:MAG TPA: MFS transporter [Trebonia sp.]|jgi:CP family cyanate transporter-like MFS transporter|nr:MFS transporter [Trebonia sp.]